MDVSGYQTHCLSRKASKRTCLSQRRPRPTALVERYSLALRVSSGSHVSVLEEAALEDGVIVAVSEDATTVRLH